MRSMKRDLRRKKKNSTSDFVEVACDVPFHIGVVFSFFVEKSLSMERITFSLFDLTFKLTTFVVPAVWKVQR